MENDFSGQTVLVTGAAGAIGRRLADRFMELGARVYQTDIQEVDAPDFTCGDLSDPEFVMQWVETISGEVNQIDVLVNVAGICPRTAITEIPADEWDDVLRINLRSAFMLSQAVLKRMIAQQSGTIISISSLAGKVGGITVGAHYCASKAALVSMTKSLARYGALHNVRANAVAPGIIDTEMGTAVSPEMIEQFKTSIPMGRLGTVDEVIEPIIFLASQRASYITGATLDINGGILMD